MTLIELQKQVGEWSRKNFGEQPSYRPLLGVCEESGELCHAHLKSEQGIRTDENHVEKKIDAVGDIVVYLADYCEREGFSLEFAVTDVWNKVKQRDWKKSTDGASQPA